MKHSKQRILSWLLTLALIMSLFPTGLPIAKAAVADHVVINQAYGGGGNSGAYYKNDFIELYNPTGSAVSLAGWSIQYTSEKGTTYSTTPLTGSISAGGYYLIQEAAGSGGTANLPAPDATGSINMAGAVFKLALVNSTTAISGKGDASVVDYVGCGTANDSLGSVAPAPSNTASIIRTPDGEDSGNNGADFKTLVLSVDARAPRNSSYSTVPATAHSAPVFTPAGGTSAAPKLVENGTSVSLAKASGAETDAKVYYKIGTETDAANITTEYTAPIEITGPTTISAVVKGGTLNDSDVVTYYYDVATIVPISTARGMTSGTATIRGVGTMVTATNTLFVQDETGGLMIYMSGDLSAYVGKDVTVTGTIELYYGAPRMISPSFTVNSEGVMPTPVEITLAQLDTSYEGKLLKLTGVSLTTVMTGTGTSLNNHVVAQGAKTGITFRAVQTNAFAVGDVVDMICVGGRNNTVTQLTGHWSKVTKVQASIPVTAAPANNSAVKTTDPVTLTATDADSIKYTVNGGSVQTISGASGAVTLSAADFSTGSAVIKARAVKGVYELAEYTFTYTQKQLGEVTASPVSGATLVSPYAVTLGFVGTDASLTGAKIYYTTDGGDPTTLSAEYTTPFNIDFSVGSTKTVKAIAVAIGCKDSEVAEFNYLKEGAVLTPAAAPIASVASGSIYDLTKVTLTSTTPDAKIYYTTDNTDPTTSSSFVLSGAAVTIGFGEASSKTLKAMAKSEITAESTVATFTYTKQALVTDGSGTLAQWGSGLVLANNAVAANYGEQKGIAKVEAYTSSNTLGTGVTLQSGTSPIYASYNAWQGGGAYWRVTLSTAGFANLSVTFDVRSSGTGPRDFKVQYSTDGTTWNDANNAAYTAQNATVEAGVTKTLPSGANNQDTLYIRWLNTSPTSAANNSTASGGTNWFQNVSITGDYILGPNQLKSPTSNTPSGAIPEGREIVFTPGTGDSTADGYAVQMRVSSDSGANWTAWAAAADNKYTVSTLPLQIEVKATAAGKGDSRTISYSYTKAKLLPVVMSQNSGAVAVDSKLTMTSAEGGTIYYTVNDGVEQTYSVPLDLSDALFVGDTKTLTIVVRAEKPGYNPCEAVKYIYSKAKIGGEKVYFGQLHAHTTNSDGAGTLTEAYAWARDNAKLDFFAVTDHSNSYDTKPASDSASTYNLDTYNADNAAWMAGHSAATAANDPTGSRATGAKPFISVYGFEMTWSGGPGHINTFNTTGVVSRNNKILNGKTSDSGMRAYYALLKTAPSSISQFNHPGTAFGNFNNFAYWDAEIDQRMFLVEVGNGEGAIGSGGYFPSYGEYTLALDKGWHVAPTNNQDNHKKGWGTSNTARTAIWTNDLSEGGLYQALRERRVYATEVNDLEIVYRVVDTANNVTYPLGSILPAPIANAQFIADISTKQAGFSIASVCLVTNGGVEIHPQTYASGGTAQYDQTFTPGNGYYYLKVVVNTPDGVRYAVTAPVWMGQGKLAGFNSVTKNKLVPVIGEAITISANLYNNETTAATLKSVVYEANSVEIGKYTPNLLISGNTTATAAGTAGLSHTYTPIAAGDVTVKVKVTLTINGEDSEFTQSIKFNVKDPAKLVYVGIDGSHSNEYVSGNYKDSMTNFATLAADYNVRVEILSTSQALIDATNNTKYQALILTAPTRRLEPATTHKSYTQVELNALTSFAKRGGTVILTGWSNLYESYDYVNPDKSTHMSAEQNKILKAIGSNLRISDDAVWNSNADVAYDSSTYQKALGSGAQAQRFYPTTVNATASLLKGVITGAEGQTFSAYGSSSIHIVDGTGAPTATVPSSVTPLVYNETNAKLLDVELGAKTPNEPVPAPVNPAPQYASGSGNRWLNTAAETVAHDSGRSSLVVVSGGAFMSNFEIKIDMDNAATLPYINHTLCENILKSLTPVSAVTAIADTFVLPEGTSVVVEGIVTSGVHTGSVSTNKGFFDSIYIQDGTGGINLFPVASGVAVGQKIRVTGTTSSYEGERQIKVDPKRIEVVDSTKNPVTPIPITVEEAARGDMLGSLVKLSGAVKSFTPSTGDVDEIVVTDGNGHDLIVYFNGYITPGVAIANLAVGASITVTGLASYSSQLNGGAGGNRIRVRDRAEVVCSTVSKTNQSSLSIDAIPALSIGGTHTLSTTGGAGGGAVTYTVLFGFATINGTTLTITGAGSIIIRAVKAGDDTYNEALSAAVTLNIAKSAQAALALDTSVILKVGGTQLKTTGGSGTGAVTYEKVSGPDGITVASDGWVTATDTGTVRVKATKAGDRDYNEAVSAEQDFIIKAEQDTLTVNAVTGKVVGDAFQLKTTGGSGTGAVTFTKVSGPDGITITSNGWVTATVSGTVRVKATKAGDRDYAAAVSAEQNFVVKAEQDALTVKAVTGKFVGDVFQLETTGGSGTGAVTFTKVSGPADVTATGRVTTTGVGTLVVTATKAADENYYSATSVQKEIVISARPYTPSGNTTPTAPKLPVVDMTKNKGGEVKETVNKDGSVTYTFVPEKEKEVRYVRVNGLLVDAGSVTIPSGEKASVVVVYSNSGANPLERFTDLGNVSKETANAIAYVAESGLMGNTGNESFEPAAGMSRAMFATVLARLYGAKTDNYTGNSFGDVSTNNWYGPSVAWAAEMGFVGGVGGGSFAPDRDLTRQELVTLVYRFATEVGVDTTARADLSKYGDQDSLGGWASQAMEWAVGIGLINGRSADALAPGANITRAEAAIILERMATLLVKK